MCLVTGGTGMGAGLGSTLFSQPSDLFFPLSGPQVSSPQPRRRLWLGRQSEALQALDSALGLQYPRDNAIMSRNTDSHTWACMGVQK